MRSRKLLRGLSAAVFLVALGLGTANAVTVTQYRCDELDHPVSAMALDGRGGYWTYDSVSGKIHGPQEKVMLYGVGCRSLAMDADGKLWVSHFFTDLEIIDTRAPDPKVGAHLPTGHQDGVIDLAISGNRVYALGLGSLRTYTLSGELDETYLTLMPNRRTIADRSDTCLCISVDAMHGDIAIVTQHGFLVRMQGITGFRTPSVTKLVDINAGDAHIPASCAFVGRYLAVTFITDDPCVKLYDRKTLQQFATIPADEGWQPQCISATDSNGFVVAWNKSARQESGRLVYYTIH